MKSRKMFMTVIGFVFCSLAIAQGKPKPQGKTVAERLGYPADSRLLVIHAEDFGMAHSVNRATMEALVHGWVTSASILVPCPWYPEVVRWAKGHPQADLGIHLDLNADWTTYRWRPVSHQRDGSGLVDIGGYLPLTERYVAQHAKMDAVETETRAQVDQALAVGISISHLDTHMRTMLSTPDLFQVYWRLGQRYTLPILVGKDFVQQRAMENGSKGFSIAGIAINADALPIDKVFEMLPGVSPSDWLGAYEKTLSALPAGVYQLNVHLGYNDEELQGMTWNHPNWGAQWRQSDFDVIRSPEFQKFLKDQGFILVSWKDLAKSIPAGK